LGEEYRVTDFIQVQNPLLERVAAELQGKTINHVIARVARFIAENVQYALDRKGHPTACRHTCVFKYHGPIFLTDTGELSYGWLFPNQTLQSGYGICFDTSVLCCTLLRIKRLEARVVLGAVLASGSRKLKGFHAWVEVPDKDGRILLIETTSPKDASIWLAEDVYNGKFPNLFEPVCRFNESYWEEDKTKSKIYTRKVLDVLQKKQETRR
jgi:hypothetical protein